MKLLSRVQLLVTPWTAAHQAPPSMGLSRQEYWSGVPLPPPDFPYNWEKKKIWWTTSFVCLCTLSIISFEKNYKENNQVIPCPSSSKKKSQTVQHQRAQRSPHWLWTLSFFLIFTQKQPLHVLTVLPSWLPTPHTLCPFFTSGFSQLTVTSSKIGNH